MNFLQKLIVGKKPLTFDQVYNCCRLGTIIYDEYGSAWMIAVKGIEVYELDGKPYRFYYVNKIVDGVITATRCVYQEQYDRSNKKIWYLSKPKGAR